MLTQVSVRGGNQPVPVDVDEDRTATFKNGGPDTVYYGDTRSVTSATGTAIASGASASLSGAKFLVVANTLGALAKVSITVADRDPVSSGSGSGIVPIPFSRDGILSTGTGTKRFPVTRAMTITAVRMMVDTAPTGASVICDVNKNGTTIYTTQANRPTVAISGHDSGAGTAPDVTALVAGDYLTVDIDQIGSTVQGSDMVLVIEATA